MDLTDKKYLETKETEVSFDSIPSAIIDEFSKKLSDSFFEIAPLGEAAIREKIQSVSDFINKLIDSGVAQECDWDAITKNYFAPSVYIREVSIKKNQLVVGKIHRYDHWNYILKGSVTVLTKDGAARYDAPMHMLSTAGTQRLLYTHEDTVWCVVHPNPTNTHDLEEIEKAHISKDYSEFPLENKAKELRG